MKRGDRNPKAAVEARRKKVALALSEGPAKTRMQIAAEVGTNLAAVKRDLAALAAQFADGSREAFAEFRRAQLQVFELMEESLVTGKADPDMVREWRAVRSEISRLLGLNAESRAVVAHVSASESSPLFLRFKKAVAGLSDPQVESLLLQAERTRRESAPTLRDASWFPAPEAKALPGGEDDPA